MNIGILSRLIQQSLQLGRSENNLKLNTLIKIFIFTFCIFFGLPTQSQNTNKKIKKLSNQKKKLLIKIEELENNVKEIDMKIFSLQSNLNKKPISDSLILGTVRAGGILREKPNPLSDKIITFKGGTKVNVIDYIPPKYYEVCSDSVCGFIFEFYIEENQKIIDLKNMRLKEVKLKNKKDEEKLRIEQDKIDAIKRIKDSIENRIKDSIENRRKIQYEISVKERKKEYEKRKIIIADYRISINSANGVNFKILWGYFNKSKIIKYIYFTVVPYNDVGDIQTCEIGGHSAFTGKITGPITAKDSFSYSEWETAWYNNTITCLKITKVRVIYTDGTSYTYIKELPTILFSDFTNDCSY